MKLSAMAKVTGVGIVAASLVALSSVMPATAQTGGTDGTGTTTTTNTADVDRDFDWGWLGLLGLAGLAGLAKRPHETPAGYRESDEVRAGNRY